MNNPFKKLSDNSRETAKKWEHTRKEPVVETVTCPQCSAPRPAGTNIAQCAYCGYQFMDVKLDIKP